MEIPRRRDLDTTKKFHRIYCKPEYLESYKGFLEYRGYKVIQVIDQQMELVKPLDFLNGMKIIFASKIEE